ncbi:Cryparin [Madurella mycetomatis]|uniref:Cryparin n=1 Tax=Madurella mycetomatis TaxID=100816 RepID=A0A175WDG7_9PEZI|nr:Cryparin [Madurella mycetomatis]
MKLTFATTIVVFSRIAAAFPASVHERRLYVPCSDLSGTARCCATDVLGIAGLDCGNPPTTPTSADNFREVCAAVGQRARCCVFPVLGQSILCNTPTGVVD